MNWWKAITVKVQGSMTKLADSIDSNGQVNDKDKKQFKNSVKPSILTLMFSKVREKSLARINQLKEALSEKWEDEQYGQYTQEDLSPLLAARANPKRTSANFDQEQKDLFVLKSGNLEKKSSFLKKNYPPKTETNLPSESFPKATKFADSFEKFFDKIKEKIDLIQGKFTKAFQHKQIQLQTEEAIPDTHRTAQNKEKEQNSLAKRKLSQKTMEDLKKAIKQYQKQSFQEMVLTKKPIMSISNNSRTNLTVTLEPKITNPSELGSKSFRISRTNQHQLPKLQARSSSIQKNLSQSRRQNNPPIIDSSQRNFSNIKRLDSEPKVEDSFDERLRKLKRENMPKLQLEKLQYLPSQRKEFTTSLNMEYLLNLKKQGTKQKLVRKQMLNDLKMSNIMKNMVNSESYSKTIDKQTRNFLEEIKMPSVRKETVANKSPGKAILNKQKLSSIYQAIQRGEVQKIV